MLGMDVDKKDLFFTPQTLKILKKISCNTKATRGNSNLPSRGKLGLGLGVYIANINPWTSHLKKK